MRLSVTRCFPWFPAVCVFGILTGCDNGASTGPGAAATELDGTWTGQAIGDTAVCMITFAGSNFSFKTSSFSTTRNAYSGTVTVNSSANPKQFDAHIVDCAVNSQYVGKTSLCIYKIIADTLTYAGNEPGVAQRPTSFTPDSSGTAVFVFVRMR